MYLTPMLRGDEKVEYVRKSRADDPLMSVDEVLMKHEQMLNDWVEKNQPEGGPIPEENKYREVVSGETLAGRPRMQELLRRVESPKIKAVLCVEPSRLSRGSLKDIGHIVEILRYTNTLVITLQYTYDLNDDRDRELFERELMRGNDYLEYSKKIMANGRLASVAAGNYIGSVPPYGFRKVKRKEGKQTCHTLEPIPEQAEAVRTIFELYAKGHGTTIIADKLDEMKYPVPKGKHWARESIWDMLANVHYIGKVKWQHRKTVMTVVDGTVKKSNPNAEEYLVFEGKHPAIIDKELWDAVQAMKGRNPKNHKAKNLYNPLAGLLWCKRCGRALTARKYLNKDGTERCSPRIHCPNNRRCGSSSATIAELVNEFSNVLEAAIEDFEVRIAAGKDDSAEIHKALVSRLEKKLAELKELEKKQWSEKLKGEMPAHVFRDLNAETVAEIEEVHQALCDAKDSVPEPIDLKEKVVNFKAALEALRDPDAPVKEKNQLLKQCIDRVEFDRERKDSNNRRYGTPNPMELDFKLRV